jgi:hypothetical protein
MLTKYSLFLLCCTLMGTLLCESGQITPALATHMVTPIQSTHPLALKGQQSQTPIPVETVVVSISGTTNSCSQILFVRSNHSVVYFSCLARKYITMTPELTNTFFSDVAIALPLNALPQNRGCLKSASFGSSIYLILQTQKSPDVSCSVDHLGRELYADVRAILSILHTTQLPPQ